MIRRPHRASRSRQTGQRRSCLVDAHRQALGRLPDRRVVHGEVRKCRFPFGKMSTLAREPASTRDCATLTGHTSASGDSPLRRDGGHCTDAGHWPLPAQDRTYWLDFRKAGAHSCIGSMPATVTNA